MSMIPIPPMPQLSEISEHATWHAAPGLYKAALDAWVRVAKEIVEANLKIIQYREFV